MWPNPSDFTDWEQGDRETVYSPNDPMRDDSCPHDGDHGFYWSRTAVRRVDGITEQVTEWRLSIGPPDDNLAFRPEAEITPNADVEGAKDGL